MTVEELIKDLQQYQQDAKVIIEGCDGCHEYVKGTFENGFGHVVLSQYVRTPVIAVSVKEQADAY